MQIFKDQHQQLIERFALSERSRATHTAKFSATRARRILLVAGTFILKLRLPRKSKGWAIGTGPSVVVVDQGLAGSLTTTNLRSDVYAFVFSQKGLMGGIGLEGSKITEVAPDE